MECHSEPATARLEARTLPLPSQSEDAGPPGSRVLVRGHPSPTMRLGLSEGKAHISPSVLLAIKQQQQQTAQVIQHVVQFPTTQREKNEKQRHPHPSPRRGSLFPSRSGLAPRRSWEAGGRGPRGEGVCESPWTWGSTRMFTVTTVLAVGSPWVRPHPRPKAGTEPGLRGRAARLLPHPW